MTSARRRLDAPAKVNLHLRVLGRRPDGYHEIETVFQAISLCDTVEVSAGAVGEGVTIEVDGPDLGPAAENLAVRAAQRFMERTDVEMPLRIRLAKRIPAGAGLGGGSSDAAAVLRCLAELTGVDDPGLLTEIAASLGADVPFFLGPGVTALGRERGDRLTWQPARPPADLVVALPPLHVSTGEAYAALAEARGSAPAAGLDAERLAEVTLRDLVPHNDFQDVTARRHPGIRASIEALLEEGARWALLSGSGAASFGLFDDADAAKRAAQRLTARLGWPCLPVRTLEVLPVPKAG